MAGPADTIGRIRHDPTVFNCGYFDHRLFFGLRSTRGYLPKAPSEGEAASQDFLRRLFGKGKSLRRSGAAKGEKRRLNRYGTSNHASFETFYCDAPTWSHRCCTVRANSGMTLFGPKTFAPKNLCKRPRPSRPAQDTRRDRRDDEIQRNNLAR